MPRTGAAPWPIAHRPGSPKTSSTTAPPSARATRDNFFYHEMMAHAPLFTHPDPREVVIIGGGDCGTLREVLRHAGVRRAVQCDIDEQVTRMAEKYFPELCESNGDP